MRRISASSAVLIVLAALAAFVPGARSAETDVRVLRVQLEVEKRLLEAMSRRWLDQLEGERRAARDVEAAGAQAIAAVRRALQPAGATASAADAPPPAVSSAAMALAQAEQSLAAVMSESRQAAIAVELQALRVSGLEAALQALSATTRATPLDGTWEIVFEPSSRGTLRLTQVGTLVTGDYSMANGRAGSVTGTLAAGVLRLERIDSGAGRDAVLEGRLSGERLEGSWLATIFGRGEPEAGRWHAVKKPEIVAAPEAGPPSGDSNDAEQPR